MTTIKGVYENGKIVLLEAAPVQKSNKVLITFIEEDDDLIRGFSTNNTTEDFKNYLIDSNEDLYQEYLKK